MILESSLCEMCVLFDQGSISVRTRTIWAHKDYGCLSKVNMVGLRDRQYVALVYLNIYLVDGMLINIYLSSAVAATIFPSNTIPTQLPLYTVTVS